MSLPQTTNPSFSTHHCRRHARSCRQTQACPRCPDGSYCQPSTQVSSAANAHFALPDQPNRSKHQTQSTRCFYIASPYLRIRPEPQYQKHSQEKPCSEFGRREEAPVPRRAGCPMHHPCSGRLSRYLRQDVQGRAKMGIEFGDVVERQHAISLPLTFMHASHDVLSIFFVK